MRPEQKAGARRLLAQGDLVPLIRPGAVFIAEDDAITFLEERRGIARTEHAGRYVIVVQALRWCISAEPSWVLVVPCSASVRRVQPYDLALGMDENAFDKPNVTALVSLVQPIVKGALRSHRGDLSRGGLMSLHRQLMIVLGQGLEPSI